MSGIDALVVAFGLFLGYWVVAKLLAGAPASDAPEWHRMLNVSPDATVEEIRAAYQALSAQSNSDEIAAAYRRAMQARGAHV